MSDAIQRGADAFTQLFQNGVLSIADETDAYGALYLPHPNTGPAPSDGSMLPNVDLQMGEETNEQPSLQRQDDDDEGYDTSHIVGSTSNPGWPQWPNMVVRVGFYNDLVDDGWGYDKAYWKHDIHSVNTILWTLQSPYTKDRSDGSTAVGGGFDWYAQVRKWKRNIVTGQREPEDYSWVHAIWDPRDFPIYKSVPGGNPLGLVTAFCADDFDFITVCPSWVDEAAAAAGAPTS